MCNGEHGRASQGGTVAILKPVSSSGRPILRRELSLRLAGDASNGGTMAIVDGLDGSFRGSHFIIHRDGDLRSETPLEESILHRFSLPAVAQDRVPFLLAAPLDLGVGGDGIIGRRISFVQDRALVGQGIIGFN